MVHSVFLFHTVYLLVREKMQFSFYNARLSLALLHVKALMSSIRGSSVKQFMSLHITFISNKFKTWQRVVVTEFLNKCHFILVHPVFQSSNISTGKKCIMPPEDNVILTVMIYECVLAPKWRKWKIIS